MSLAAKLIQEICRLWAPPKRTTVAEWAEAKRFLPSTAAAQGKFSLAITPYLRRPLECLTDPKVRELISQKSAQVAWTDGVVNNFLGYTIDVDPAATIVMFPRDKTGKDFNREKFEPMIEATPALSERIELRSRSAKLTQDFKRFAGGFIKFVGSNSPGGLKSTSAGRLIVEEPDDCNLNVRGQGDSIALIKERGNTFGDFKLVAGGTPTIKGLSAIEEEMQRSDKQFWHVPCHHCGKAAPLSWDFVKWSEDPSKNHPVYGAALPETARYVCSSCGGEWNDAEKNRNVRAGKWVATAEFRGVAGFYMNGLMSPFPGSSLVRLVEKYLEAKRDMDAGDVSAMITFWNASLGLPWEFKGKAADPETLAERAEDYPEWTIPWGGLILTVGVDVQHNRLAVVIRAWGRGEESWLVWFGELFGNVLEEDVWNELDRQVMFRRYRHAGGSELTISAASIDCSDGQTADAVYKYVRRANRNFGAPRAMAIKGAGRGGERRELFSAPGKTFEVNAEHKGAKYGLRPYIVGTSRAKDLILGEEENAGRVNLRGRGPGRMHVFKSVRADYFEQLTAEVKAPARNLPKGRKAWQLKAGKRNEALDGEVYALHAARALRIDTYPETRWAEIESAILQATLFQQVEAPAGPESTEEISPAAEAEASSSAPADTEPAQAPAVGARPVPGAPVRRRVRHSGVTA